MMATADALAAYLHRLDDAGELAHCDAFAMICELHEDWAILAEDAAEIVSAKHREPSVGRLGTLRSLLGCGVLHLFERWETLGRAPMCRLVTTAGVADDAAKLDEACVLLRKSPDAAVDGVRDVLTSLGAQIAFLRPDSVAPTTETLTLFVASLRIQHGQPRREHLPDMAPTRYAKPIADRLGRPDAADAIWGAVLALVRERMRAAGPTPHGGLPMVLGVALGDALYASRTLTLADVDVAVRVALRNIAGYVRLPRLLRVTRLAVKMAHGGCSDNTIERVDSLRLQHRGYWRGLAGTPAIQDRRRRLSNLLLKVVAEVTEEVRTQDVDWGVPLLVKIENRLQAIAEGPEAAGLDAHLLLGGIADLSNNCKVWFSDRFDVEAEISRLKAAS